MSLLWNRSWSIFWRCYVMVYYLACVSSCLDTSVTELNDTWYNFTYLGFRIQLALFWHLFAMFIVCDYSYGGCWCSLDTSLIAFFIVVALVTTSQDSTLIPAVSLPFGLPPRNLSCFQPAKAVKVRSEMIERSYQTKEAPSLHGIEWTVP